MHIIYIMTYALFIIYILKVVDFTRTIGS
jgi:hypothetical protein